MTPDADALNATRRRALAAAPPHTPHEDALMLYAAKLEAALETVIAAYPFDEAPKRSDFDGAGEIDWIDYQEQRIRYGYTKIAREALGGNESR